MSSFALGLVHLKQTQTVVCQKDSSDRGHWYVLLVSVAADVQKSTAVECWQQLWFDWKTQRGRDFLLQGLKMLLVITAWHDITIIQQEGTRSGYGTHPLRQQTGLLALKHEACPSKHAGIPRKAPMTISRLLYKTFLSILHFPECLTQPGIRVPWVSLSDAPFHLITDKLISTDSVPLLHTQHKVLSLIILRQSGCDTPSNEKQRAVIQHQHKTGTPGLHLFSQEQAATLGLLWDCVAMETSHRSH